MLGRAGVSAEEDAVTVNHPVSSRLRPLCHFYYVHATARQPSVLSRFGGRYLGVVPVITGEVEGSMVTVSFFTLDIHIHKYIIQLTAMKQAKAKTPNRAVDAKASVLGQHGAFHPHPEQVRDELFERNEFFDPRDLVHVRYEMLRRRQVDGQPVTDVATAFGVSRQAFYVTETAFAQKGIVGLLPRPRGPRRAHKCTEEILDFVEQWATDSPAGADISEAVQKRFGVAIHPRSLVRALGRRKKNQH